MIRRAMMDPWQAHWHWHSTRKLTDDSLLIIGVFGQVNKSIQPWLGPSIWVCWFFSPLPYPIFLLLTFIVVDHSRSNGIHSVQYPDFDRIVFEWNGKQGATLYVRFNCLSTDFSRIKGVKGIPLRLHMETTSNQHAESTFCRIKLFRDKVYILFSSYHVGFFISSLLVNRVQSVKTRMICDTLNDKWNACEVNNTTHAWIWQRNSIDILF